MVNQHIEKLLILQDRDQVVRRIIDQLEAIPLSIKALEAEIQAEKDALEESKSKLQGLEIKRKDLDMQVGSAEEQIRKYKNQQLQVKKNEEFQALTHEIELTEEKIAVWEEEEIGLMLEIDAESEVFSMRQSVFDGAITKIREKISIFEARKLEFESQLGEGEASLSEWRGQVEAPLLTAYDRIAVRTKLPIVVPLEQQTCKGCHLRVSNDTLNQARRGEELTTCDNCGRVVFLAS
jgi:uncharacterized protein